MAALGCHKIDIFDHDTIEEVNITTQGYLKRDIEKPKAKVMASSVRAIDKSIQVTATEEKWTKTRHTGADCVFLAVDKIDTRKRIWELLKPKPAFLCDARMLGMTVRCLTAFDPASQDKYAATFFESEEAEPGRCTARSAIWPASMAACLMVNSFVHFLNGSKPPADVLMNLRSYDFSVSF